MHRGSHSVLNSMLMLVGQGHMPKTFATTKSICAFKLCKFCTLSLHHDKKIRNVFAFPQYSLSRVEFKKGGRLQKFTLFIFIHSHSVTICHQTKLDPFQYFLLLVILTCKLFLEKVGSATSSQCSILARNSNTCFHL